MIRTVSTFTTGIEAHIVKCRLEYEGIPAFVAFEHHIWAMWSRSVALGGVRVQVPTAYLETAKVIVRKINAGEYESELNTDELKPEFCSCPNCDSEDIKTVNWSWKTALLVIFLFSVPLPYTRHQYRCNACSHIWVAHDQRGYPLYVILSILLVFAASSILLSEMWCHWCKLHCENPYVCMP